MAKGKTFRQGEVLSYLNRKKTTPKDIPEKIRCRRGERKKPITPEFFWDSLEKNLKKERL